MYGLEAEPSPKSEGKERREAEEQEKEKRGEKQYVIDGPMDG